MSFDPFESGKAAGERTASDYIKWSQSVHEIEKDGMARISAIHSRLKPIFDEIGFSVSNTGSSISVSPPGGDGPHLSIQIAGEYISGNYVRNSDKYLVQWRELTTTNGLGESRREDKCDVDRVFEIAGTFYGNWKHLGRTSIHQSPSERGVSVDINSISKTKTALFRNVMIVAVLFIVAYLWLF